VTENTGFDPTAYNYPLPRDDQDKRLTFGLVLDVAEVLSRHGYPDVTGMDHVDLQSALFRFLYGPRSEVDQRVRDHHRAKARGTRWRINPETLALEPEDEQVGHIFTAQDWQAQEWPPCPVCGTTINVAQVDVQTSQDPVPTYIMGRWQCPNNCDPRPVLRPQEDK
jgi:hypothetical protein